MGEKIMETFKASVQYGDWKGTAAADDIDPAADSMDRYLEQNGLMKPDEFLLAAKLWVGENSDNKIAGVYIRAYLLKDHENYESVKQTLKELEADGQPIPVREVSVKLTLEQFVALFKRFAVTLTYQDLPLEGREYSLTEE
jgi:hypothetical protein